MNIKSILSDYGKRRSKSIAKIKKIYRQSHENEKSDNGKIYAISIYPWRHFVNVGSSMMIVEHDDC